VAATTSFDVMGRGRTWAASRSVTVVARPELVPALVTAALPSGFGALAVACLAVARQAK